MLSEIILPFLQLTEVKNVPINVKVKNHSPVISEWLEIVICSY